jgi:hypothetical protein
MSDSVPTPGGDPSVAEADTRATTGVPRWVKISLIAVIGLVALFAALHFAGMPMGHGPSRHMGAQHEEASAPARQRQSFAFP